MAPPIFDPPQEVRLNRSPLFEVGRNELMWAAAVMKMSRTDHMCVADHSFTGQSRCQEVRALPVDAEVERLILTALAPDQIALAIAALGEIEEETRLLERQWSLKRERVRYDAERARRQYDAVEPENRLVARSLERVGKIRCAARSKSSKNTMCGGTLRKRWGITTVKINGTAGLTEPTQFRAPPRFSASPRRPYSTGCARDGCQGGNSRRACRGRFLCHRTRSPNSGLAYDAQAVHREGDHEVFESPNTLGHSPKARLVVTITELRS
jgi:hypothetical protein